MPLIVLEGPEGAGKTTQLRRITRWLDERHVPVIAAREPGGTPLGDEIRRLLLDPASDIVPRTESLLFMASRAQLVQREIVPALATNQIVLLDRFFLSTYAYQVAGRGLPENEVIAANKLATATLRPDVTLLLTLPVQDGLRRATQRGPHDRMERAETDFHERVARAFEQFAMAEWQVTHPEAGPVIAVDATGTEDQVFGRLLGVLARRWPGTFAER